MTGQGAGGQDLLRAATIALEVPGPAATGPTLGTGFLVAPGIVATCAHVLGRTRDDLPARVAGRLMAAAEPIELETVPEWYLRHGGYGLDLAFLRVSGPCEAPHVLLSPAVAIRDSMWTYGYPRGQFRAGQSAGFTYQGPSRLESEWELLRVTGTPVSGGYSGSPVLNLRTGAVCGMLCLGDKAGRAHLVPAAEIIAGCPEVRVVQDSPAANLAWLSALSDEQIRAGGWLFPGPRLRAYLDTAVRAAQDHPYPGVVPGITPPPLTAVYVQQQADTRVVPDGEEISPADLERRPAEEILDQEEDCVLVGGPGAGKSSLLRTALVARARRWQRGETGAEIPVHVLASDLVEARPLPEAIAAGVTASLSVVGILRSWSAEFFADTPLRGVRWLVLVDGLDEVLDPAVRRRILGKLAGLRQGESSSPYRFIVATRPLPAAEFPEEASWPVLRYELQPFAADQLAEFAERWFTELRVGQPPLAAGNFVRELGRTHLADPARTPLMATMLCQLFAMNPGRPLPAGRSGAYAEFVELLRSRQYADNTSGIYAQMQATLGSYGPDATGPAATVLTVAMDLIARLALARQDGDDRPALDLLATWTAGSRPRHVPEQKWRSFLREILRRSGLLTQRADDFQFIHQTVGEFLAARHLVADATRGPEAFHALFGSRLRPVSFHPKELQWDDSYSRFIVAAWPDKARLTEELDHLAAHGGLAGCRFIASLAVDQAVPSPSTVETAAATLAALAEDAARDFTERREACETLAQLGDSRGTDQLAAMAGDPAVHPAFRRYAAEALARLGDRQGPDLLAVMAAAPDLDAAFRRWAARALVRFGDGRGTDLLLLLATDPALGVAQRRGAAGELVRLCGSRSVKGLAFPADDAEPEVTGGSRQSARTLARIADRRVLDRLAALAADSAVAAAVRLEFAEALAEAGDDRAADALAALAGSAAVGADVQAEAAWYLGQLGDDRAADALAALAGSAAVEAGVRGEAAWYLTELNDCRAVGLLAEIAAVRTLDVPVRVRMARHLGEVADPRRSRRLAVLPADENVPGPVPRRRDRRAVRLLAAVATDPSLDDETRATAAWELARLDDRRGSLLRRILVSADPSVRHQAARELAGHGDYRAVELLAALAADPGRSGPFRGGASPASFADIYKSAFADIYESALMWGMLPARLEAVASLYGPIMHLAEDLTSLTGRAAEALAGLGDPRGAELLAAKAARAMAVPPVRVEAEELLSEFPGPTRSRLEAVQKNRLAGARLGVAEALARCGDLRGADLLAGLAVGPTLPGDVRVDAAGALARFDDPRGGELLAGLAADAELDAEEHGRAAGMLARLGDGRHADVLATLAADASLADGSRLELAEALAGLGDPRGGDLLADLAYGDTLSGRVRADAAEALARLGDPRGGELLAGLATDDTFDAYARGLAAEVLARLGDGRYADVLAGLAADAGLGGRTRLEVAEALARSGDSRGTDLLAALADDPALDGYVRRWAAGARADVTGGHPA